MNRRTKFYIGVSLVISAITATVVFITLCFKKKSAIAAIAALAATEGLVGLALIEDNNILKRKKVLETDEDICDAGDEVEAERIEFDIPTDDEASEEDFV